MDEVLLKFESVLGENQEPNEESKSNFEGLYKNWGKLGNQEERRKEILESQKINRNNKLDKFRGILELVQYAEEKPIFRTESRTNYRPSIYVAGFNKTSPTYSNVLMMSEWIIEKPHDFNENWYVVPCPKGVRMLVVATQGKTRCYSKFGQFRFEAFTALPGGHRPSKSDQCCVLDCFYDDKINTMYVLDLLAWNSQPMTDGETEFRQFWLQSKMDELPSLKLISKRKNEMIFELLPKVLCTPESFQKFMMTYPPFEENRSSLDGLLFYHKYAHYVSGQTPLVGWLYPYMVPEVLGSDIAINDAYAAEKPESYVSQADFIEKFEAKPKIRMIRGRRESTNAMDTADASKTEAKPRRNRGQKSEKKNNSDRMEAEEIQQNTDLLTATVAETETKLVSKNDGDTMEAEEAKHNNNDSETKNETVFE